MKAARDQGHEDGPAGQIWIATQAAASGLSVRCVYLFLSEPRLALVTPRLLSYIFLQKMKDREGGAAARNERSIQEKGLDP